MSCLVLHTGIGISPIKNKIGKYENQPDGVSKSHPLAYQLQAGFLYEIRQIIKVPNLDKIRREVLWIIW